MSLVPKQEEPIPVSGLNPSTRHRKARVVQYRTEFFGIELPHHLRIDQLPRAERHRDAQGGERHRLIHQALDADLVPSHARIVARSISEILRDEITPVAAV